VRVTPDEHARLIKIAGLLASDQEGERASAAARASEILSRNGLSWAQALAAIPVVPLFQSDTIAVEPMVAGDELTRLRSELATSEALRHALAEELAAARPAHRDLF
jgi:hypothetical protein